MAEIPNWLAAIPVMAITVIKVIWSLDLITTTALAAKSALEAVLDGALWLGLGLGALALFFSGSIGFVLMIAPSETVPAWWAAGSAVASAFLVVAWYLLTFQEVDDDE